MKRFLIISMMVGLMVGFAPTAEADTGRTVEARNYGAQLLYGFGSCSLSGGAGCVTIATDANERSLTAEVTDAHGLPVSVTVVDGSSEVYGIFCGRTTEPIRFDPGSTLELWVGGDWWPTWWIVPELPRCSPGIATTGTVHVALSGWVTSEEPPSPSPSPSPRPVESPAPQPSPSGGQTAAFERSVDLELRGHLRGVGSVVADDASCRSGVPVVIQRKTSDAWLEVGSTTTDADGAFAARLTDRPGRYRAIASEVGTPERTCLVARSATVRHRH